MRTLISGFGCVCALGGNTAEISKNLFNGVMPELSFQKERLEVSFGSIYPVFTVPDTLAQKKKDNESLSCLFLKTAVDEALFKAGLDRDDLKKARVGVCIGSISEPAFNCYGFYRDWKKNEHASLDPLDRYINYSISREVLKHLGTEGISQTIVTSCASGSDAIGIGAEWIENSLCDVVIAGSCDELHPISYVGFASMMLMSKKPCKPFDKNRDGTNLGEGAGVVILESERFAERRNAQKYGSVLGYGNTCDGYHSIMSDPKGSGLKKALNIALNQAGISNDKISFIIAHAPGFKKVDLLEARAYKEYLEGVPVTATKSLTGHALGAASAISICLSLICLNECKIPKTHNFSDYDESIGFSPVLSKTKIEDAKAAVTSSIGFGGINSVLVLGGQNYE